MKTQAMLLNDLEYGDLKNVIRDRIHQHSTDLHQLLEDVDTYPNYGIEDDIYLYPHYELASDIFVYPEHPYPSKWHAVFGIMNTSTKDACVILLRCDAGNLIWEYHGLHGTLPSGALCVI